ncbi:hypothetical protein AKJ09_06703 [Labilithrix luteola]|uniref:Uncharacterized protein n=1 Tax=Labilithrix luteola TaxID=1391654 RepID=A0A0K1Q3S3_9BACT|nr:hypothetical protein [Labilithrix luteola]AKV00040.1 hypothetical protein AKJ09_06703 [Labilithrix luteola]
MGERFFPNATVAADKFRVLWLLTPAISRHRKANTDQRSSPAGRL